jgi:glycosyltransferase involved in cell wall biosynthesis
MLNYYPWYCGLSQAASRDGLECDTLALRRSRLAIYSSAWAAKSAIDRHGGDPAKIRVLPFGANLESGFEESELEALIPQRLARPWQFLLVGVDWTRKGADIALQVVGELNRRGFPSELVVADCQPPRSMGDLSRYLKLEGFLDKQTTSGHGRLAELYRSALFYFMPSRAEAYGIVYCEANAFGVPCLATDTGGVCSLIQDGVNGQCFATEEPTNTYADVILSTITPGGYPIMARNSLRLSRERLNWNASVASLIPSLRSIVSST